MNIVKPLLSDFLLSYGDAAGCLTVGRGGYRIVKYPKDYSWLALVGP